MTKVRAILLTGALAATAAVLGASPAGAEASEPWGASCDGSSDGRFLTCVEDFTARCPGDILSLPDSNAVWCYPDGFYRTDPARTLAAPSR